jgi:hypothetical protein
MQKQYPYKRTTIDRESWELHRRKIEEELRIPGFKRSFMKMAFRLFGLFLKLSGLKKRGMSNALNVQVRRHQVLDSSLPKEFSGFRILQISDPHFDIIEELPFINSP